MAASPYVVARDDFLNAARSYVVLGVVGALVGLVALVFVAESGQFPDPYRTLNDVAQLIALLGPILLVPLTYLSIAGERASGRVKYVVGLPTSRESYLVGKFLSRLGVAVAGVVAAVSAGFVVALATFENAPDVANFAAFAGASALYVLALVSVFVAISASVERRSRAVFGAVAVYFLLVPFWLGVTPPFTLETLLSTVGDVTGTDLSESTRELIGHLSPLTAYGALLEPIFLEGADEYERFAEMEAGGDALHDQTWFHLTVLLAWTAIPLTFGYLRFRRAELD